MLLTAAILLGVAACFGAFLVWSLAHAPLDPFDVDTVLDRDAARDTWAVCRDFVEDPDLEGSCLACGHGFDDHRAAL
jgi:hypothetical protein